MVALSQAVLSRPMILLVVVGFLLALMIIIAKTTVSRGVGSLELAFVTNLGAGIILFGVTIKKADLPPWTWRHIALYFVLGIVSFGLPNVVTYVVADKVGPAYSSMVYSLSPLMTFAFAAGFGVEKINLVRGIGLLIGFSGATLIVSQIAGGNGDSNPLWVFLGLIIPASVAIGNVIRTAFWPPRTSPLSFAGVTLLVSALQLFVVALFIDDPASWLVQTPAEVIGISAMALTASLFFLLLFHLQQAAGPVFLSQIGYWATGFGVVLSAVIYGDLISLISIGGIVLIIAGAFLAKGNPDSS